jgi:4'-phosphopantetheinyl transferase
MSEVSAPSVTDAGARLACPSGVVQIWRTPLSNSFGGRDACLALLSSEERSRAERLRNPAHRRRYISAHSAGRRILAAYLGCGPEQVRLVREPGGKPVLAPCHGGRLAFSVSRSANLALCAVASNIRLGIDIEQMDLRLDSATLEKLTCSASESALLAEAEPSCRLPLWYRCWTRKEAYLKARGVGLAEPLDAFSVLQQDMARPVTLVDQAGANWTISSFEPAFGYVAAVAVEGRYLPVQLRDFAA